MPRLTLLIALSLSGCKKEGCLTGNDPSCVVPTPCAALSFQCSAGNLSLRTIQAGDPLLAGDNPVALASIGDVVLQNDQVWVVIEAIDHPHYIAPTGGGIVDMGAQGSADSLRNLFQTTGLLPNEAAHYTKLRTFEGDDFVAVQVHGTLDGFPDIPIVTRYELRACEPGVRMRTEIVNRSPDPQTWFVTDAWYWGGRELLPFTAGAGFVHPSFGLTTVVDAMREVPFMVAGTHVAPASTYATVACEDELVGFQSEEISAIGRPQRVVMPRDYEVFERFQGAVPGPDIAAGIDLALELRRQLFGERYVTLSGSVQVESGPAHLGEGLRAAVSVTRDDNDQVWSHTVPDTDGNYVVRVPPGHRYRLDVESYGQQVASSTVEVGATDVIADPLVLPAIGEVTLNATVDGLEDEVLIFAHPADEATRAAVEGKMYTHFNSCAPLLGNPHGPSPACNRILVNGPVTVPMPAGRYDFAAIAGLFSTLAVAEDVRVGPGRSPNVSLELQTLDLAPTNALQADFHVHGSASFDASIPDRDRVRAFLAARLQVLASTEHDASWDYARAMAELGAADRLHLIVGTESTGHILFPVLSPEVTYFPKVIGHWNVWPLRFDPTAPYRGAPWDELVLPGQLFDRYVEAGWPEDIGVIQLNHPVGGLQFGRNFGWASALELNTNQPLRADDGTGNGLFEATPAGAGFSNADYDTQEVMNGTNNGTYLGYRRFWFYLLNQGVVRTGTANSDSHTLTENVMGIPRNLVLTSTTFDDFDLATFDADVRAGHLIGTNGPVLQVSTTDVRGRQRQPDLEPFEPAANGVLVIDLSAAPWVPLDEIRVVVNGQVVKQIPSERLPRDPYGSELYTQHVELPLSDLLPASGDAWLLVEAGQALVDNADLDCDGIPDTGDHNGDGRIDGMDVLDASPKPEPDDQGCYDETGPLKDPPPPLRGERGYGYSMVVPNGFSSAFTNPLIFDRDGGGYQGVE